MDKTKAEFNKAMYLLPGVWWERRECSVIRSINIGCYITFFLRVLTVEHNQKFKKLLLAFLA